MTRIDVNANKATIKAMSGIGPFNETMTFFYDESGNCRKFLLTKDGVNSSDAIKGDFVLGGVAFDGLEKTLDFQGLYDALNFREGQKELKFRHLYNKSYDFLAFIRSVRATAFLHWLKSSGLYIHYSAMNNLFYSLVDIVDSLWEDFPNLVIFFWEIKSALYDFAADHTSEIISLLYQYNYPNVSDCYGFCSEICGMIKRYNDNDEYYPGFFLELLRQMLATAGKKNRLVFIQDNTPFLLIKEYYLLYLERCELFSKSIHVFDEEPTVQKQLQEIELIEDGSVLHNYRFIPSEENIFIQLSDLVSGMLRSLFMFLDSLSLNDIPEIISKSDESQADNFATIMNLLSRSNDRSKLFIKNANTPKNLSDRERKLQLLACL